MSFALRLLRVIMRCGRQMNKGQPGSVETPYWHRPHSPFPLHYTLLHVAVVTIALDKLLSCMAHHTQVPAFYEQWPSQGAKQPEPGKLTAPLSIVHWQDTLQYIYYCYLTS